MSISEPFARVLAAGRTQFNARVAEARHRYPTLDAAAFAAFLATRVDPVVCSVAQVLPEHVFSVALVAYDMALELVAQGLAGPGARSDLMDRVWSELAPKYPQLLAAQPLELLGALSNAAVSLGKVPGVRTTQWLADMVALSHHVDSMACLRSLGQITAWRCGFAHYRRGALEAADLLPESTALAAVGAGPNARWEDVRARFAADPWWLPQSDVQPQLRPTERCVQVGQFTGLGGTFSQPPRVWASGEGFGVQSADRCLLLMADAFGAVLLPAEKGAFERQGGSDAAHAPPLRGATLLLGDDSIALDLPPDGLALAWNAHTVAVTSPYTFAIRLFARPCP